MQPRTFAERFLKHLDKIDPSEIEAFVLRAVRERDFTARIFETLIEGVVVFDSAGRVSLVNSAARGILRWPMRKRLLEESLLDLLETGPLRELVEDFLADPRPIKDQEMGLRARSKRIFNVHLLPIAADDEGTNADAANDETSSSAAALILQDLTPARDRQERDAQARQIASLAALTAGVAHDIKNPLNSLSIHAQLIEGSLEALFKRGGGKRGKNVERVKQSCLVIGEEVERLRKCVDDLIEAARPRKPSLRMCDLNTIVRSVVRMARLEFEALDIRIESFLDADLPALPIDEEQMIHVLRNLLRNAVEALQAARQPREKRQIVLRTAQLEETVTLEVSDNGCGISKEDLPKVFEPYFTTKFSGSGLGLMAVGRIVREHGGEISVQSIESEGATFTIEFPIVSRRVKLLDNK